ncbi:MAG: hypothetical protein HY301_08690 [Verrucomicrobia bacterium]|nr:hypothetical protein [Verrucomicrobiota bacterium]
MSANEPARRFGVTVAYEDDPTRDRALRLCNHLAAQLVGEVQFDCTWWKFSFLPDPVIAMQAERAASEADMVIISAAAGNELPQTLTHWIEQWIPHRKIGPSALVGLIGPADAAHQGLSPRHNFLRDVAARAGMDYLPEGVFTPGTLSASSLRAVEERAEVISPVLDEILTAEHPMREWGLNE